MAIDTGQAARRRVRTLPQQIADDLGAAIVRGDYAPGERLVETAIAERYGVSRGPVREAIRALAQRGLAVFFARRGAFVVELSLDSFIDLFNTRSVLLGLAARYFATVATSEATADLEAAVAQVRRHAEADDYDPIAFAMEVGQISVHIHRHCGSPSLSKLISHQIDGSAWGTLWRQEPLDFATRERRREAARLYTELCETIRRRDADAAERLMRALLMRSRMFAVEHLSKTRSESFDHRRLLNA